MITLKTSNKNPIRFIFSDLISETTVTISPDDDSGEIAAKLQRVLELENAQRLPYRQPGAALTAAKEEFEPLLDVAAAEAAVKAQPVGWESFDVEDLPEA